MKLVINEDQRLVRQTARQFFKTHGATARLRAFRDGDDPTGFSEELWAEMGALGWFGMLIPEAFGGAGLGLTELNLIIEEAGRTLAPEPFIGALLGTQALLLGGTDAQRAKWLPRVAEGKALITVAFQEAKSRYDVNRCGTVVTGSDADGYRINGAKIQVLAGLSADALVISARRPDVVVPELWLIDPRAEGLSLTRQVRIDHQPCALLELEDVALNASDRLSGGDDLLQQVVDRATVGLCAEMVGAMQEALDSTLAYLRERKQFEVPIGTFQALQHRAARMYIDLELARTALMAAGRTVDLGGVPEQAVQQAVSLAKARCSDAFLHITNEGLQMFGGVGMTDEYDIGLYLKRARVAAQSFGDAAWHRDRWARIAGY